MADAEVQTFKSFGLCQQLVEACENLKWKEPTPIQAKAIPPALQGKDLVGHTQTVSGKTGAFVLPILQALLENPKPFFACVLSPTRFAFTQWIAKKVDYIHRVGRTARAGKSGIAISFSNQYTWMWIKQIEELVGKEFPLFPCTDDEASLLMERISEARRIAVMRIKEQSCKRNNREEEYDETDRFVASKGGKKSKKQIYKK